MYKQLSIYIYMYIYIYVYIDRELNTGNSVSGCSRLYLEKQRVEKCITIGRVKSLGSSGSLELRVSGLGQMQACSERFRVKFYVDHHRHDNDDDYSCCCQHARSSSGFRTPGTTPWTRGGESTPKL